MSMVNTLVVTFRRGPGPLGGLAESNEADTYRFLVTSMDDNGRRLSFRLASGEPVKLPFHAIEHAWVEED